MKQKTAVDFLWNKVSNGEHLTPEDFEQAKEKEKQQIVDARLSGIKDCELFYTDGEKMQSSENYYSQTYSQ